MTNRINNKLKSLPLISAVMLCFFCDSCAGEYFIKRDSFITCYTKCDMVYADISRNSEDCIVLLASSESGRHYYLLNSTGEDKDIFESLCAKHKDRGYDDIIINKGDKIFNVNFINRDFSAIEIYSEDYFDANHPAGGSVADIVRFMSVSPCEFINGSYKKMYHYDATSLSNAYKLYMPDNLFSDFFDSSKENKFFPVDKMVNALTKNDLILLGTGTLESAFGYLCFEKKPEVPGEYRLNVNVIADDGEVFRNTVTMKF